MSINERYRNDAQQRILKIVMVLFGHVVDGLLPSAIAREVGCSAAVMTRDLANLREAGIADRDYVTALDAWLAARDGEADERILGLLRQRLVPLIESEGGVGQNDNATCSRLQGQTPVQATMLRRNRNRDSKTVRCHVNHFLASLTGMRRAPKGLPKPTSMASMA